MVSPGASASTPPGTGTPPDALIRRLTIGFCLVALLLGALQAWTARFDMNPDGIQYLDNAAAYWHRDFHNALNSQWSPLYPWLIGALNAVVHPSREQEFPLVHVLNFFLFAMSLAGFLFFVRPMQRLLPASSVPSLLLLSYSAFLYCSLDFTSLGFVTPDLLVNFFAFVAAGLLVRIAAGDERARLFSAVGMALGLGYLAKAPFLPIGVVCLVIAGVLGRKRMLVACAVFAAIAAPYVWALSEAKGHFTFGDSAQLNVAWHVNGLPNINWQGGPAGNGRPVHPTRQLSTQPAIFEFARPIAGTYPPWYDPAYWNEGVRITYRAGEFARAIVEQVRLYGYWLHHRQLPLLFALLALLLLSSSKNRVAGRLKTLWPVLALGAMPFAMYAPVHAESRYLAPFFVLLWTAVSCAVLEDRRISLAIATTAALLMLVETVIATFAAPTNEPPARLHYEIARELQALGLNSGDHVAIVDSDFPYYWAWLADARVTLQISFDGNYARRQAEWTKAAGILWSQNASFLVSPALDGVTDQPGWRRLGTSNVFAYPAHPSRAY
ncbi:MAG TPA: hypothetical protein VLW25_06300 [Bryobacteraceae bacterium]|nr:hypothetical protein [Bryobacteraceae bacterium]